MKTKKLKQLFSLLLCLCMVAGLLPATALAVTLPDGTETGTVSATIYLDNGDGQWYPEEMKTTFAADQAGLILHLSGFDPALPNGSAPESISFYPVDAGENEWGTVFWYSGGDNGTANNKLYNTNGSYNGVFQILNFTPNGGGMGLESGTYNVLVYVSNGSEEKCYLSDESFTINGPAVTKTDITCSGTLKAKNKVYDGTTTAEPDLTGLTLTGVAEGDDVHLSYDSASTVMNFADANVGADKTVTATSIKLTLTGKDAEKYNLTNDTLTDQTTASISKADVTVTALDKSAYVGDTEPDLSDPVLGEDYKVEGLVGGDTLTTNPTLSYASTPDMSQTGEVTISITGDENAAGGNYNNVAYVDGKLSITKVPVTVTALNKSVYVGDTAPDLTNPVLGTDYTVVGLRGEDALTTLPMLTYVDVDKNTISPDTSIIGTVTIKISGAEVADSLSGKYEITHVDGTLSINARPYSGGSSGSATTTTTTQTTKNPDGSTTKTTTDKTTGAVTETTTSKPVTDAAGNTTQTTTETVTNKDGSTVETVTETVKAADGSTAETKTEVKTDADGAVTTTETVTATDTTGSTGTVVTETNAAGETTVKAEATVSDQAVTAAAASGAPVTLPVEVAATTSTETAPVVKVKVPATVDTVKVEIPVEQVTPGTVVVIVHEDGTEEIVSTSIPTENGVVLTLEGSATVKVIDNARDFSDVSADHWSGDAVAFASARSITDGTSDTTFSPNTSCTRAQIVTFLWRAAGAPEPENAGSFSDVSADSYYAKAAAWAIENGITSGTGDGKFSPDDACTRSQSAVFLYRAAGSPAVSGDSAFGDVSADAYYADAVKWAEQNGVTGGIGNGQFGSGDDCTRAQIVTFLYRFFVK